MAETALIKKLLCSYIIELTGSLLAATSASSHRMHSAEVETPWAEYMTERFAVLEDR